MYSILEVNGAKIRKAKGVQKTVVKKDLRHELYKQCLDEHKAMKHKQIVIRSHGHQMGVYEQNNTSLSPLDTEKVDRCRRYNNKGVWSLHYNPRKCGSSR